jgi:isoquinoline 1-oxidoreductase subunit beta
MTTAVCTRRTFLRLSMTAGGALVLATNLGACTSKESGRAIDPSTPDSTTPPDTSVGPTVADSTAPAWQPDAFLRIERDGTVTCTIHRSEMGQGVRTALAMIIADELDAEWSSVRVEQAPADIAFGDQTTGGSASIAMAYERLRTVAASARELLTAAAAKKWGVTVAECHTVSGAVVRTGSDDRRSYGELVGDAATLTLGGPPRLKEPSERTIVGTSVPRIDEADIVRGRATYGIDVARPGMLRAVIARCPVAGGTVRSHDDAATLAVRGVRSVVPVSSGLAVVADTTWAAMRGREALQVTWDEGSRASLSSASISAALIDVARRAGAAEERPSGLTFIEAMYETAPAAHAPMEPLGCVAEVRDGRCQLWLSTQNPQVVQRFVERAIGVPVDVHVMLLGGGFGRRLEVDDAVEAAETAQVIGAPVHVVWTRDDDLQHDFYRQPSAHWMRAGWDAAGELQHWRHYTAAPGINGLARTGGRQVVDEGRSIRYNIPSGGQATVVPIDLPTGPWRAVMHGPNAFANESFLDEVAAAMRRDPVELRLALLRPTNPLHAVVALAAEQAGWGSPLPAGRGRGIACHNTWDDTPVAMVAEVSVAGGAVTVHRVVCAADCGTVIHPGMVAQQMEGAVAMGLTSMLKPGITIEAGRVQQHNFDDHPLLRCSEMPEVEVHLVPSSNAPGGVGEMGIPPIVPAVANAVFACTGRRVRRLPVPPDDLIG